MAVVTFPSQIRAPALPNAPPEYNRRYADELNSILRLYFNRLDSTLGQLMAVQRQTLTFAQSASIDAFGRTRVSQPYTLFDSQSRYADSGNFDTALTGSGTATYVADESSMEMEVTTVSGDAVVRQSYRVFPYQPGKSLLVLSTLVMAEGKANLLQRAGYFSEDNGVFLEQEGTVLYFTMRTSTSGTPVDTRIAQDAWNGDQLDGRGASGFVLDVSKAQILWQDFEWLGVGSVRCGFVMEGEFIIAHTFHNANVLDSVYMTTAILPVRYEIENLSTTASASLMKHICASVITEGGYDHRPVGKVVRRTSAMGGTTTIKPLLSVRLASDRLDAVVLPGIIHAAAATGSTVDFEVLLIKGASLTGASYDTSTFANFDYDITASALTDGTVVAVGYVQVNGKSTIDLHDGTAYNFQLQLGRTMAGVSDVYTVAARTLSGTGDIIGALEVFDLT